MVRKRTKTAEDYTSDPRFERKVVSVTGVKVLDEAAGIVEAVVSGIGNVDDGGDIVMPTFFTSSLETHLKKLPKGVWSHDWDMPVAKTLETYTLPPGDPRLPRGLKEVGAGGQYVKGQFNLRTTRGRDAFEDVRFFSATDEQEWSIGYVPIVVEVDENGNRQLKEGAWYEWSPVLFGMNPLTATIGVKALADIAGMSYDQATKRLRDLIAKGDDADRKAVIAAITDVAEKACACDTSTEDKASVSDSSWDGAASRFDDDQWKRATAACEGKADATVKQDCYLPHHEPDGAINRNGVHAAAGRFNQANRSNKDKAKSHLAAHYFNDLKEDVPAVLGGEKDIRIPDYTVTAEAAKALGWELLGDGDVIVRDVSPKNADAVQTKGYGDIPGTIEEQLGEVNEAISQWVFDNAAGGQTEDPDWGGYMAMGWSVGTFDDHVIGMVIDWTLPPDQQRVYYSWTYTLDADGAVVLGEPTEVELETVVSPKRAQWALTKALKEGRRHSKSDEEALQAIHDSAVTLGAVCGEEKAPAAPSEPVSGIPDTKGLEEVDEPVEPAPDEDESVLTLDDFSVMELGALASSLS